MYKVVEKSVAESGVTEKNIYPNKDETLNKIKAEEDIAALQLLISKAPETQASWLKVVIDKTGKDTVTFKISSKGLPSQIGTKEELDQYIDLLREKLESELEGGKTIIVE